MLCMCRRTLFFDKGTTTGIICLDLNTRLYVALGAGAEIKRH